MESASLELHRQAPTDTLPMGYGVAAGAARVEERERERRPSRTRDFQWRRACVAVDAMMLGTAVAAAEYGAAQAGVPPTPAAWLLAFPLLVVGLLWTRRLYASRLSLRLLDDVRAIAIACSVAGMAVLTARELFAPAAGGSAQAVRLWAFSTALVAGGRAVLAWSELGARRRGETLRPTLIVGAGRVGRLAARRMLERPELGLRPVGFLDKEPREADDATAGVPVLGASWDLERIVGEHGVEHVIVTFSTAPHEVLLRLVRRCEALGVRVAFVPRLFDQMTERLEVEHVGGLPLLAPQPVHPQSWQFRLKHVVDRAVAAAALLVLAPVLLGAALAVRISLGRPILFRQTRVGRDGRVFEMLKFRSMHAAGARVRTPFELPPDVAPGGVEGRDLRTRVGEILRRTSIDELPQLLNVLKGEMSLIGPRPERPEYVERFSETVYRYDDRHRVKAGITGWAQVHGLRGQTSISERAELDNYYAQNWSLWLEVKILVLTIGAVLSGLRTVQ